jgi:pimeloyl-ACP methyl ester carboxylesterase
MTWRNYQAKQRIVELGDRFVSYVDEGEGDPVILLHGIPTWGYLWEEALVTLAREYRVLIPDLLGFGYSDKSDCFDRGIDRQAEMIAAWMDVLGVSSAAIAGHDIGGGVALRLATLMPQRVRRLGLLNTVCYDSWPIEAMLQLGHPEAYRKLSSSTTLMLLKQALKRGFASSPDSAFYDGLFAPYATEVGKLSLIRNAAALNTNLTTEITALLSRIQAPTLILWGEEDVFLVVAYAERLAKDIPSSRLVMIPNARHFVMIDQASIVSDRLRQFLGEDHGMNKASS